MRFVPHHILHRLEHREIDVVLVATPVDEPSLYARELFDEPFWLAHPRDSELYNHDEVSQQDLDGLDCCCSRRDRQAPCGAQVRYSALILT
jgi:DNA-binding transcriptional LysR family regulator